MKAIALLAIGVILCFNSNGQKYYPFPKDNAQWNNFTWAQWGPDPAESAIVNSKYILEGDTIIKGLEYSKVYYQSDYDKAKQYICGLREDTNKNVYVYSEMMHLPNYCGSSFPSDTSESLLYTFNNLEPGMALPINQGKTTIQVIEIDSVMVGCDYRKRYKIQEEGLFAYDYWIEGIGSTKDLFAPYSYEFEWTLYALCFTDSTTYHLNWPWWSSQDSCHISLPYGIEEIQQPDFIVHPNPTSNFIFVDVPSTVLPVTCHVLNIQGQLLFTELLSDTNQKLDVTDLKSGVYLVWIESSNKRVFRRFVKE